MNEKIKELEAQCWEPRKYGPAWFNAEKFAELIVRECAQKINTLDDALVIYSTKDGRAITKAEWLLKQFGIDDERKN